MSEGTSSNLFPDKEGPLPSLTTEQLDKLFSTEFVPRFTPSSSSSAVAAAPVASTEDEATEEEDDGEVQDEASAVVHDPEWYEHLGGHDEAALSSASDVMDAVQDWEENTPLDELPDSSKVCTFWVRNKCRIVNCPFLHQYYGVRCHHYQDLGCIKGDECPYVHTTVADQRYRWELMGMELVPPPLESFLDLSAPQQQALPSKADFPALGATPAQQQQEALEDLDEDEDEQDDPELGADVHVETAAERLSFQELRRMFNWVPRAVIETIFIQCGRKMEQAKRFLKSAYPQPQEKPRPVVLAKPKPEPPKVVPGSTIDAVQEREPRFASAVGRSDDPILMERRKPPKRALQVASSLRTKAFMHAKMRNMHFRLAAQAFAAGNGAVAKRHSELGKKHDRMMRELHNEAAQKFFKLHNPLFCSFSGTNENVLDLHGLTIREAIDFLTGIFVNTKCSYNRTFYVICGAGRHSEDHLTPLADAVRQYCTDRGFRFNDCSADQRGGMLRVRVPRNTK